MQLIAAAEKGLEQDARALCDENSQVIARSDRDCELAFRRSQARMQERIDLMETSQLKLQKEIEQCGGKIDQTRQNLHLISASLQQHEIPLETTSHNLKLRQLRDPSEAIRDEVAVGLTNNKRTMEAARKHLQDEHANTRRRLHELEETRRGLETQLRDTNVALQTDLQCQSAATYSYA
jgi:hypothetical protein